MSGVGRLISVVGPSGVGKDSVIAGLLEAIPDLQMAKRIITRPPGLGGEDYTSVSEENFQSAVNNGEFCLHWRAHGSFYGISEDVLNGVEDGQLYIANLSRSVLLDAAEKFAGFIVIQLTASPGLLAQRLAKRGRENKQDIAARLDRSTFPMPQGLNFHSVSNDGVLQDTVDEIVALLNELLDNGLLGSGTLSDGVPPYTTHKQVMD
ncbi:MAG: phosphonate metabolism protein/1,5-bisphosphokinase (PRPP-forming) PhnN [Granulosicoccus sp.]|nr:phosphonate metabolism protein/1,5-bisphosphokinase (PRPP-forming) PhnN [Granulosicoccus sp.]